VEYQVSNTPPNQAVAVDTVQEIELSELRGQNSLGAGVLSGNMGLLNGLSVTLNVVVGEVTTTLGELMNLKESSVLKVEKEVDSPVDVVLNGNVVARGRLVVVDDSFGIKVTEIASFAQ